MALDGEVQLETGLEGPDALHAGGGLVVVAERVAGGQQEAGGQAAGGRGAVDKGKRMARAARWRRDTGPSRLVGAELQPCDFVGIASAASLAQQDTQPDGAVLQERGAERSRRVQPRE